MLHVICRLVAYRTARPHLASSYILVKQLCHIAAFSTTLHGPWNRVRCRGGQDTPIETIVTISGLDRLFEHSGHHWDGSRKTSVTRISLSFQLPSGRTALPLRALR